MRTLTTITGNPAHAIIEQYQTLMGIRDLTNLREEALKLAKGFSPKNLHKFRTAVAQATSVDRLQGYLTNFILAADGNKVIR